MVQKKFTNVVDVRLLQKHADIFFEKAKRAISFTIVDLQRKNKTNMSIKRFEDVFWDIEHGQRDRLERLYVADSLLPHDHDRKLFISPSKHFDDACRFCSMIRDDFSLEQFEKKAQSFINASQDFSSVKAGNLVLVS